MATQSLNHRLIVEHVADTGENPEKVYDEQYTLSEITDLTPGRRLTLAPGAADQAVAFTDCLGILITTRDYDFDLRLAAGETLLENLRTFFVASQDTDEGVHQASVLLTGNGSNEANLEIWLVEKP